MFALAVRLELTRESSGRDLTSLELSTECILRQVQGTGREVLHRSGSALREPLRIGRGLPALAARVQPES
jgi:hypothetical protein